MVNLSISGTVYRSHEGHGVVDRSMELCRLASLPVSSMVPWVDELYAVIDVSVEKPLKLFNQSEGSLEPTIQKSVISKEANEN